MHWQKTLPLSVAAAMALVATAGAASSAAGRYSHHQYSHSAKHHQYRHNAKNKQVRAKVHKGTLTVTGSNGDDNLVLALRAGDPSTLDLFVDGNPFDSFDRSDVDNIVVDAAGGNDEISIDESNGAFTTSVPTTLDGGPGDDRIAGGSGVETLLGGDGNDTVDGNRGNDTAFLGTGDDTFIWDPGDGSDTVEGETGNDTMRFNGANIAEKIDLSANGRRLRLFRDIANITMDTAGVETVDINALGGADTVTVNDLTGTDVTGVHVDNGGPDGQPDQVTVNGTAGNDSIAAFGGGGTATVKGLVPGVVITGAEPTADTLKIDGRAGDDVVDGSGLAADAMKFAAEGEDGADVLIGGSGDDVLSGGVGDDVLRGGPGLDTLDGGPGNNVLIQD